MYVCMYIFFIYVIFFKEIIIIINIPILTFFFVIEYVYFIISLIDEYSVLVS